MAINRVALTIEDGIFEVEATSVKFAWAARTSTNAPDARKPGRRMPGSPEARSDGHRGRLEDPRAASSACRC